MRQTLRNLGFSLLMVQAAMPALALQAKLPIPGRGVLNLELPSAWKETQRNTPENLPPTFEYTCSGPVKGSLQLTLMWDPKNDPSFSDEKNVRETVLICQKAIKDAAIEKELPLLPLKGIQGTGFYFSATEQGFKPGPGQFPIITTGALASGKLQLIFTILSDTKNNQAVQDALSAIAKASVNANPQTASPTEISQIDIPGEGWAITFEAPHLSNQKEGGKDGIYQFGATSSRFNISLFVEPPANSGRANKDCYDYYWPKSSRNPQIDKNSIKSSISPNYHRVQYDVIGTFKGESYTLRNVNYYFSNKGKWVDVHISIINPRPEDESTFMAFDRSLSYGVGSRGSSKK